MVEFIENTFCGWDLLSLAFFIAVVLYFAVRSRKLRDLEKDLEDRIAAVYTENIVTDTSESIER